VQRLDTEPLGAVGLRDSSGGNGDERSIERRFAKDRRTRIAIIHASVLDACNDPQAAPKIEQRTPRCGRSDWASGESRQCST
jgi:hypothetical protein